MEKIRNPLKHAAYLNVLSASDPNDEILAAAASFAKSKYPEEVFEEQMEYVIRDIEVFDLDFMRENYLLEDDLLPSIKERIKQMAKDKSLPVDELKKVCAFYGFTNLL